MRFESIFRSEARTFFARELSSDHTEGTEALGPHDRSLRLRKIMRGRLGRLNNDVCR